MTIFEDRMESVVDAEGRLLADALAAYLADALSIEGFEEQVARILDPEWIEAHREMLIDAPPDLSRPAPDRLVRVLR